MRRWIVLMSMVLAAAACSSDRPEPHVSETTAQGDLWLGQPRAVHRAVAMGDGTVLITGGCTEPGCGGFDAGRRSEVYDPERGIVTAASMSTGRASGTATLLADGRVLLTGGYPGEGEAPTGSAEVYDPRSGEFAAVDDLGKPRADHTASLLADGRVLLAGGFDEAGRALADTELFDPVSGDFTAGSDLIGPRAAHVAVSVGRAVLLVGGTQDTEALATTEV